MPSPPSEDQTSSARCGVMGDISCARTRAASRFAAVPACDFCKALVKAKSAAMYGPYVLLFDPDFVEIRNAQNGRLRQVIAGRDVKCLDDGLSGTAGSKRSIKMSLQHPQVERCQVVVELVLNEGQKE